ncbi:MAG: tetratricopeptide repeat protein [Acidobacteria bacterium]|nr:tetratricopeptide repeat protein [Acidobacteriota bacterium]
MTTQSEEARKEFLEGRDLFERLLAQDSIPHYDKAIEIDPNFALAELGRANAAPTAKDFFDHLKKAVAQADKASEGERLLILATQAGAEGNTQKQREYLEKLVAVYPNDERAQFNLGGYYFAQQEYPQAIEHYKKATELAPGYSPVYNILGYSYRQVGDYANAEQVFKKYTELIPNDPNPYDSYAELLMKMGRYDESIAQYRKALSIDPNFIASHFGISGDLMYMGKPAEATAELQKIMERARSDGDRRTAMFGITVVDVDSGRPDDAIKENDKLYALGEKTNDVAAMSFNAQTKGNLLAEMGKFDAAKQEYDRALKLIVDSSLGDDLKENTKLFHHYNLATVAVGKKDLATAKNEAEEFRKGAAAKNNALQLKQAHELAGIIALAQKQFDGAIAELRQASQENPRNLYRLCQAYQAKGDSATAREYCARAAQFNSLPQLNLAYVRVKAKKMAGDKIADSKARAANTRPRQ